MKLWCKFDGCNWKRCFSSATFGFFFIHIISFNKEVWLFSRPKIPQALEWKARKSPLSYLSWAAGFDQQELISYVFRREVCCKAHVSSVSPSSQKTEGLCPSSVFSDDGLTLAVRQLHTKPLSETFIVLINVKVVFFLPKLVFKYLNQSINEFGPVFFSNHVFLGKVLYWSRKSFSHAVFKSHVGADINFQWLFTIIFTVI